jgi:xanthine dehydrogenase accessory factor
MRNDADWARPTAIVVGSGDVGSAIAVVLHRAGCAVVICDDVDPAWIRRGMSFANAWYVGNAELDGEAALFCASVKSIPSVLDRLRLIAATTWSWVAVAAALHPVAVVDATPRWRKAGAAFKSLLPDETLAIGVGSGAADVDFSVEGHCGDDACKASGTLVHAACSGRFATSCRIGDRIREGEIVGAVGAWPVAASRDGVLRGLAARGARIAEGAALVEVDPRGDPVLCFGVDADALAVGHAVHRALSRHDLVPAEAAASTPDLTDSRYRVPRQA